jgi:hypothetical protein
LGKSLRKVSDHPNLFERHNDPSQDQPFSQTHHCITTRRFGRRFLAPARRNRPKPSMNLWKEVGLIRQQHFAIVENAKPEINASFFEHFVARVFRR